MNFKAVIFDLDGTLLDTISDISASMNEVLFEMNYPPHSEKAYKLFIGEGIEQLVRRAFPEHQRTEEEIRDGVKKLLVCYHKNWNIKTRPFKQIPKLLASLAEKKLPLNVLSNKPDELTQKSVQYFFPEYHFENVLGAKPSLPHKPDPASALLIASKLKLKPSQIAYFGDTDIDMQTARNAGMFAVGVLWGFRQAAELKKHGAALLLKKPLDFLRYLN